MIEILLIPVIVTLIFYGGFWDDIDERLNKRFPLHHLGKPFNCAFCQTFWLCIIYTIVTGTFLIPAIALSLILAYSTELIQPLYEVISCIWNWMLERLTAPFI